MNELNLTGETRVAVAGDWHGNSTWANFAIPAIRRLAPDIRTILHAGDFGVGKDDQFLNTADYWGKRTGLRTLVTPGNHEYWPRLDAAFSAAPGQAVQLSESVWILPRGYRFEIGGRSFLSFGGAASVDREFRTEGKDWFPSEMPAELDVRAAIVGGTVDVMISHETVNGGTPAVEKMLRTNPMGWSSEALAESSLSRLRVTQVWAGTAPAALMHGHMHVFGEVELESGQRIFSLGRDMQDRNVGVLSLPDLGFEWLDI